MVVILLLNMNFTASLMKKLTILTCGVIWWHLVIEIWTARNWARTPAKAVCPQPGSKQTKKDIDLVEVCLGRRCGGPSSSAWRKPAACVAHVWSSMLNMSTHLLCHQPAARAMTLMVWQAPLLFSPLSLRLLLLLYLPLGPRRCLSIALRHSLHHLSARRLRTNAGRSRDEKVCEDGIGVCFTSSPSWCHRNSANCTD